MHYDSSNLSLEDPQFVLPVYQPWAFIFTTDKLKIALARCLSALSSLDLSRLYLKCVISIPFCRCFLFSLLISYELQSDRFKEPFFRASLDMTRLSSYTVFMNCKPEVTGSVVNSALHYDPTLWLVRVMELSSLLVSPCFVVSTFALPINFMRSVASKEIS